MMSSDEKRKYVPIRKDNSNCRFWFFSPLIYTSKEPCESIQCRLPHIDPLDTECRYRPLLTIGLWFLEILRRILLPVSGCAIGVVHAKGKDEKSSPEKCDPSRKLVRACDLPVYADEKKCVDCALPKPPEEDTLFTETIKCARKEIWFLMDQARIIRRQVENCLKDLKTNSEETLNYLREESNLVPRVGAIAVGGLSGYILALRRGFFRKLLYTSIGTGGMAALCYPREAKEYSEEGVKQLKRYFIIGYHFLNGVSRDLTGYQLPPLPNGHLVISDSAHPGSEAVPSSAHILPPTATPTHIPLPHEDPHEIIKNHHHHQSNEEE